MTEKLLREMGREAETHRGRKTDSKESKQQDVEIKNAGLEITYPAVPLLREG